MAKYDSYETPLGARYASKEMMELFSARTRVSTWRQLWVWLAEAEKELGLEFTDEQIQQLRDNVNITDEGFKVAAEEEKRRRHDVMAHVYAFGQVAPKAAGIIHVGATSCYVTDNADLIFLRDALNLLLPKLAKVIDNLSKFAMEWKDFPILGFTHYQAAQPITLGRRVCQWAQDLMMDLEDIEYVRAELKFRGAQGATGSQASFMEVFNGDEEKIDKLNEILCKKAGFPAVYDISTQTYTRKVDLRIANAISALGATAVRIAADIRHHAHDKVMDEPFESTQIGSSAMSFKRNPMRSERICALGRKLKTINANFADTFSNQWFERTLDDSAVRRMDIPEMFLLADSILLSLDNVTNGLVVNEAQFREQLAQELPFMVTENILMRMVQLGISRQDAHEEVRVLSHQAAKVVKQEGKKNDLVDRMKANPFFAPIKDEIDSMMDPKLFIGRSAGMTERFAGPGGVLDKKLEPYRKFINSAATAELNV
ncbi:hypothetical protein BROUX41_000893 [Berkeleyomyces rouxiae]|uniref:uncharacterized protein n=1 Tax=Berkeleyomyces rouxiae TaxID=2035830 RepID=UPI003B81CC03